MTEKNRFLFHQIFGENPPNVKDLPKGDETRKQAEAATFYFDSCVDYLREQFPNQGINALTTNLWRAVGNKITPAGITPNIPTLSFYAEIKPQSIATAVLVPSRWSEMVELDTNYQLGAVVFVASQVQDFTQAVFSRDFSKFADRQAVITRSQQWEAEYLLTLQIIDPSAKLNDYQQQILTKFPRGIKP